LTTSTEISATVTTTTFTCPTGPGDLSAYWDMGTCGPYGDDHNKDWCEGHPAVCAAQVTVNTSVCSSGAADFVCMHGTGHWGSVVVDSCTYAFFAHYTCSAEAAPTPAPPTPVPTPEPTPEGPTPAPTPCSTGPSALSSYWDM
jgi:hypothetical protein